MQKNMNRGLGAVSLVVLVFSSFACTNKTAGSATAHSQGDVADAGSVDFPVRATELANRAEIERLIAARTRAIADGDWDTYVGIIHPAAAVEATGSARDHREALKAMLMKIHELADGMLPGGFGGSPEMELLGIVRENDRLHALASVGEGTPLLISFRRIGAMWMLDVPPEMLPFVSRSSVKLPPDTDKVPDDVKAAFDSYAESQKLLSRRSMLEYARSMHPDGLRVFQEFLRAALGKLTDENGDPIEGTPPLRHLVEMASKPPSEFYAVYNESVYRDLPMAETKFHVIGGARSHDGIWLVVRREDSLGDVSRSFLVKALMRKHQGVWKHDIGAEIGPDHADLLAGFLSTMTEGIPGYQDSIESIKEAGRGSAEDGAPYRCTPGVGYLFKVVGASRSTKEGYRSTVSPGEGTGRKIYVNESDIGLCDGHLRLVSRDSTDSSRISIGLTKSGQESFAVFTERYLQEPVAMMVGSEVTSAPVVMDIIRSAELTIPLPSGWAEERIRKYITDLERSSRKLRGVE